MGTKKTTKPLEWLQPVESNKKRSLWALNYLRRENARMALIDTRKAPLDEANLNFWIGQMQASFERHKQGDAELEDQLIGNAVESIDTRMRRAWDSQINRTKPGMRVHSLRMPKDTGAKLSALRFRWTKPKAAVVQALVEDAYSKEKRFEELEKAPAKDRKQKKIADVKIRMLTLERDQFKEQATRFRELAKMLTWKMTETEYRKEKKLPATGVLEPSHMAAIKALRDEAFAAYVEVIEGDPSENIA